MAEFTVFSNESSDKNPLPREPTKSLQHGGVPGARHIHMHGGPIQGTAYDGGGYCLVGDGVRLPGREALDLHIG